MLSDALRQMQERMRADDLGDRSGLLLTLRAFELEARNMEDRLQYLTGAPHVALGGRLVSTGPIIEIAGKAVSHGA